MKTLFAMLMVLSFLNVFPQTDKVVGNYSLTLTTKEKDVFDYRLTLLQDGTFTFHYYSNIKNGIPPEKNTYGKGNWTIANNVVSFFSDKQKDLDEKYSLDFTHTKARFVTKSPRDLTDKIVPTQLRFLTSDIFWLSRIDLVKN